MGHCSGHSCGTLLWDTHTGHSCGTLLWAHYLTSDTPRFTHVSHSPVARCAECVTKCLVLRWNVVSDDLALELICVLGPYGKLLRSAV